MKKPPQTKPNVFIQKDDHQAFWYRPEINSVLRFAQECNVVPDEAKGAWCVVGYKRDGGIILKRWPPYPIFQQESPQESTVQDVATAKASLGPIRIQLLENGRIDYILVADSQNDLRHVLNCVAEMIENSLVTKSI